MKHALLLIIAIVIFAGLSYAVLQSAFSIDTYAVKTFHVYSEEKLKTIGLTSPSSELCEWKSVQMNKKLDRNLRLFYKNLEEEDDLREGKTIGYTPNDCDDLYYNYHYIRHYCKQKGD